MNNELKAAWYLLGFISGMIFELILLIILTGRIA